MTTFESNLGRLKCFTGKDLIFMKLPLHDHKRHAKAHAIFPSCLKIKKKGGGAIFIQLQETGHQVQIRCQ